MEKLTTSDAQETAGAVYEVSYLLLPSISTEQIEGKAKSIKDALSSIGAEIIFDENPVLIDLAYSMVKIVGTTRHKVTSGYFGWVKFAVEKEKQDLVKKYFDANDEVIRHLIIKTVRENTLLNGKMKLQKEERSKRIDEENADSISEIPKETVPEEIDKSIDDLVIA